VVKAGRNGTQVGCYFSPFVSHLLVVCNHEDAGHAIGANAGQVFVSAAINNALWSYVA
jgi:hypothetical protein